MAAENAQRPVNDDSCVIRIDDGKYSLLLTGDAEKKAEAQLIRLRRDRLAATVLQVGHHGSRTSSTPPFLRAVNPGGAGVSISLQQMAIAGASSGRQIPGKWHYMA